MKLTPKELELLASKIKDLTAIDRAKRRGLRRLIDWEKDEFSNLRNALIQARAELAVAQTRAGEAEFAVTQWYKKNGEAPWRPDALKRLWNGGPQ
jgi:hypothetical protein